MRVVASPRKCVDWGEIERRHGDFMVTRFGSVKETQRALDCSDVQVTRLRYDGLKLPPWFRRMLEHCGRDYLTSVFASILGRTDEAALIARLEASDEHLRGLADEIRETRQAVLARNPSGLVASAIRRAGGFSDRMQQADPAPSGPVEAVNLAAAEELKEQAQALTALPQAIDRETAIAWAERTPGAGFVTLTDDDIRHGWIAGNNPLFPERVRGEAIGRPLELTTGRDWPWWREVYRARSKALGVSLHRIRQPGAERSFLCVSRTFPGLQLVACGYPRERA